MFFQNVAKINPQIDVIDTKKKEKDKCLPPCLIAIGRRSTRLLSLISAAPNLYYDNIS